jgi:GAF domain-containing protein
MGEVTHSTREPVDSPEKNTWLPGLREALAAALEGAPLESSLGMLVRVATGGLGPEARGGFYLANPERTAIHHVAGMPAEYADAVNGFKVGPDSLACGLATHTGQPILTADVTKDPLWQPWLWMAEKFGYRACWSFPIHTAAGSFVGTFAVYWPQPREATSRDKELAATVTQLAGIIIARHMDADMSSRTKRALRASQAHLQSELADSKLLQSISAEMVHEGNVEALYEKILDAAVAIMRAQYGCMKMYYPERGSGGELRLLASRGFSPEWVRLDPEGTCEQVLRTGCRAIAEDIETCEFVAGTPDREVLLNEGVRTAQSTPLVSRGGVLVGTISTCWAQPHKPTERELRLFDMIARQAADLIERTKGAQELRESEERFRAFTQATFDVVYRMNADWTEMRSLQGRHFISDTLEPSRTWLDKYIHPEDTQRSSDAIQRAIRTKSVFELEHRVMMADGTLGWIRSRAIPILDDRGEIVEWFGAARDVTQRKQAEETR